MHRGGRRLDPAVGVCNFVEMRLQMSRAWLSMLLFCGLLSGASAPFFSTAHAGVDSTRFTAEETRRLDAGQLVFRRMVKNQGRLRLMGGSSWQVIDARPDVVWRALLDTPRYRRMMP